MYSAAVAVTAVAAAAAAVVDACCYYLLMTLFATVYSIEQFICVRVLFVAVRAIFSIMFSVTVTGIETVSQLCATYFWWFYMPLSTYRNRNVPNSTTRPTHVHHTWWWWEALKKVHRGFAFLFGIQKYPCIVPFIHMYAYACSMPIHQSAQQTPREYVKWIFDFIYELCLMVPLALWPLAGTAMRCVSVRVHAIRISDNRYYLQTVPMLYIEHTVLL